MNGVIGGQRLEFEGRGYYKLENASTICLLVFRGIKSRRESESGIVDLRFAGSGPGVIVADLITVEIALN